MAKGKEQGISYVELETALRQKKFAPLYLFFGEEDFLIKEALELLITEALDESTKSFNLDIVYGSDVDAKDIVSLASSFPMMGDRRAVIVKEFDKLSNKEPLLPYIEHPSSSTSLCFVSVKPDFRTKFFKSLEKAATLVHCKQLYDNEIPGWILRRVEKLGKRIEPEACQLIQAHVGKSLNEIQNEIDKLFIYIGEKKTITVEDVDAVVGVSREFSIFELQRAVGGKNMRRSVEILERMMSTGESPLGMIVMLTRYFQKVWLLQELQQKTSSETEFASSLGVRSFTVKEYKEAARNYSGAQLQECFAALIEADEKLKSSGGEPKLMMLLMVHRMLRAEQQPQFA